MSSFCRRSCHLSVSGPESSFCLRPCRVPTRSPFLPLSLFCTRSLASELDVDACVYMCTCTCVLQPGTIPKVSKSTMPFPMRENIKSFCDACRSLGYVQLRARLHAQIHAPTQTQTCSRTHSPLPHHRTYTRVCRVPDRDNFTTDDLFEQRNMKQVHYTHARTHEYMS